MVQTARTVSRCPKKAKVLKKGKQHQFFANVIIYLDFLFSPMEYRWLMNALDF
jgi:hypothetical protein